MYKQNTPFLRRPASSGMVELDRLIALLPVAAVAALLCGFRGVFLMLSAAAGGALAAALFAVVRGRPGFNLRPVAEGLVFVFVCPLSIPLWMAALGAAVAAAVAELFILFGKQCLFSTSAFVWLFFLALSPAVMSTFPAPSALQGMETFATPSDFSVGESVLYQLKTGYLPNVSAADLLLGRVAGGFGGAAVGAAAVALLYLAVRKSAAWEISLSLIGTLFLGTLWLSRIAAPVSLLFLMQMSGGSLLFASVFMAGGAGAPKTRLMRFFCGSFCGALILLLRFLRFEEFAVPFAVLCGQLAANAAEKAVCRHISRRKTIYMKEDAGCRNIV
ncbi:MAG: RnfABCDGE type electron transport complex subunit D [Candidatus Howiella sp.]|jgi:electron transport complex protein RnfD